MDALHQNLERVREAADGRDVWAVVKANAYGHGLSNAVKAFAEADGLATIDICDAAKARACGWTKRILLLEGFFEQDDIRDLEKYDIGRRSLGLIRGFSVGKVRDDPHHATAFDLFQLRAHRHHFRRNETQTVHAGIHFDVDSYVL